MHYANQESPMPTAEKKVLLFLVEGISDEVSFQGIWEDFFENNDIRVFVLRGDITTQNFPTATNILTKFKEPLDKFFQETKIKKEDIQKIVHLIDTDGAFAPDSVIEKNTIIDSTSYTEEKIITKNPENIIRRNNCKKSAVKRLYTTSTIYNGIPYEIYYLSRNLEHVLHNEIKNLTDAEKKDLSEYFDEKYAGRLDEFITFINNPSFAVQKDFRESWNFIMESTNSLHRYTNIHLLFKTESA